MYVTNRLHPLIALHPAPQDHPHPSQYLNVHTTYSTKIFAVQKNAAHVGGADVGVVQEAEAIAVRAQFEILGSCVPIPTHLASLISM